ncbi:MAG TPA: hypothetical protein VHZ78_00910 [Rhizomicrobium sp.]|jgi:hypothetical protein|nr:hypothetical protein [Rhizomicrobium sp.]
MTLHSSCACGHVQLETEGAPIFSAVCYCDDCQEGARRIEALPGAGKVLDGDGGSAYILFRKDRVRVIQGAALLKDMKVKDASPTKRVIASCCHSAMYLGFDDSKHWLSLYRARFAEALPPVQMRICTKFKPAGAVLPNDVPSYPKWPGKFLFKLLGARLAMLLGR